MSEKLTPEAWSQAVAELVVDALRWADIIRKEHNDRAIEIAAEEIYARLCVRDYPPPMKGSPSSKDA